MENTDHVQQLIDVAKSITPSLKAVDTCEACGSPVDFFGSSLGKWRPMEAAPKDGTKILAVNDDKVYAVVFYGDPEWIIATIELYEPKRVAVHNVTLMSPTYWMPLPSFEAK